MSENAQRPNIKFTGRDLVDRKTRKIRKVVDPIVSFQHVRRTIEVGPAEMQKTKRVFYHADARIIRESFPHLYKLIRTRRAAKLKGAK
jgi:hypothetical protein